MVIYNLKFLFGNIRLSISKIKGVFLSKFRLVIFNIGIYFKIIIILNMPETRSLFTPHMPEVYIRPDIESVFSKARSASDNTREGEDGLFRRQVVIVTPGRLLISKICPLPSEISAKEKSLLSSLISPQSPLNVAVIAFTYLESLKSDLLQAIPFFGYLLGFAALGHRVWVFEGHSSALTAGCRDADFLLVDREMQPFLGENDNWRITAQKVMRGQTIKIINR